MDSKLRMVEVWKDSEARDVDVDNDKDGLQTSRHRPLALKTEDQYR